MNQREHPVEMSLTTDEIYKFKAAQCADPVGMMDSLTKRIQQLEQENTLLAAGLWNVRECLVRDDTGGAVKLLGELLARNSTALRDLLAPTIEILRQATLRPITWQEEVKAEIERLKAITKGQR